MEVKGTDLVLDRSGRPHVSFIMGSMLVYAFRSEDGWALDTVGVLSPSASSVDLFSSGEPAVSYVVRTYPHEVCYAHRQEGEWLTESVGALIHGTERTCLAIDAEDIPHILYHYHCYINPYNAATSLNYCTRQGADWETEQVLSYNTIYDGVVHNFDLTFHPSDDQPRTTYGVVFAYSTYSLDYAWPDSRPEYWNWRSVVTYHDVDWENSLCVDGSGVTHCSFRRYSNLCYATGDSDGFVYETVDPEDDVAEYSDVCADSLGTPHIVYDSPNGLRYATRTGSIWVFDALGEPGDTVRDPSIGLDSLGRPNVVWVETVTNRAMYARFEEPSGASGGSGSELSHITLAGVSPNPVRGEATAEISLTEPATLEHRVFSLDGRLVWEEDRLHPRGASSVRLPSLEPGVYFYRVLAFGGFRTARFTVCD